MCAKVIAIIIKGSVKWRTKNRCSVALLMPKPPQIHLRRVCPSSGTADTRLVITVAAQNLICPQGSTYPIKAVAIDKMNSAAPASHGAGMW